MNTYKTALKRPIELMAPAGSWESLSAALKAGADSVYFGVGNLNMRARSANNFSVDDLGKIHRLCQEYGTKAYLTLNTILFDEELEEARVLCQTAVDQNIDAIIAADPAVLQIARNVGLPIHLSVQANVTNLEAVEFYSNFADVIVLAREVSLDQIRGMITGIKERPILGPRGNPIQIEIFAHGALCVAYSGKCQMSLSLYGPKASATRGACFQPCRRTYNVTEQETGNELVIDGHQVMSPKDLCTLPFLDQILEAGVSVLKIEGRGRSPDFVATVVRVYREAIDSWKDGTFQSKKETGEWMASLSKVFHRGFWEGGYYLGKTLGDWAVHSNSQATETKVFVGQITKIYTRIGVAETVVSFGPLQLNDELWVIGETTGAIRTKITELRLGDKGIPVHQVEKGATVTFPITEKVRIGDKLYRIISNEASRT